MEFHEMNEDEQNEIMKQQEEMIKSSPARFAKYANKKFREDLEKEFPELRLDLMSDKELGEFIGPIQIRIASKPMFF